MFRREIFEAEIMDRGLVLQNVKTFHIALKLKCITHYMKTSSKLTVYPKDFRLEGVFKYGMTTSLELMR